MPPKKGAAPDKAKTVKTKAVDDKTFGLKNKNKSSKVQKYVQQLEKAATSVSQKAKRLEEPSRKDKKKAEEEKAKELQALFAMAIKQPKVPVGVDPKSILCEYFRHGQCTKGFKCKFSHDLNVERKGPKLDLYSDKRDGEEDKEEGMDDWDQETLEKAIAQKHGLDNKNRPTEIVCKFFIDAVEKRQYGWFWQCPNGKDCKYRHALPEGYVLKSQMKMLLEEEAANAKSVEEIIEEERAKVDAKTPITEEVFKKWKEERDAAKREAALAKVEERRKKGIMTGREIFAEEGFIAQDDASASDAIQRDVDEEAEIQRMHEEAKAALLQARAKVDVGRVVGDGPSLAAAADAGAADAVSAAAKAEDDSKGAAAVQGNESTSSAVATASVQLTEQEEEDLFDDDDDDVDLDELTAEIEKKVTT